MLCSLVAFLFAEDAQPRDPIYHHYFYFCLKCQLSIKRKWSTFQWFLPHQSVDPHFGFCFQIFLCLYSNFKSQVSVRIYKCVIVNVCQWDVWPPSGALNLPIKPTEPGSDFKISETKCCSTAALIIAIISLKSAEFTLH